jgi:tRNA(Ile)-lysidine synthase
MLIEDSVRNFIAQTGNELIFLIAVSGGPDSMALLYAFISLRNELKLNFCCAHIQHNLRGEESLADEAFVEEFCKKNNVLYYAGIIPSGEINRTAHSLGCGIEAAARMYRFSFLQKKALEIGASYILTAHTKDDAIEHLLIRVLRGSGPAGLSVLTMRKGNILRPLLEIRRKEIIDYLEKNQINYRLDSSNSSEVYLRNKIRLRLIPLLNKNFCGWDSALFELGQTQSLIAEDLQIRAKLFLTNNSTQNEKAIFINKFFEQSKILREEIIFEAVDKLNKGNSFAKNPRRIVVRDFCNGKKRCVMLAGIMLTKKRDMVLVEKTPQCLRRGSNASRTASPEKTSNVKLSASTKNTENPIHGACKFDFA